MWRNDLYNAPLYYMNHVVYIIIILFVDVVKIFEQQLNNNVYYMA